MSKLLLTLAIVLPSICFADQVVVSAVSMQDQSTCNVTVPQYKPGSSVMYLGNCGWTGLKGTGAYVQAWNHSNHIKIVRGEFYSGKIQSFAKITYINMVTRSIETYEQNTYSTQNLNTHDLDNVLTDAKQAGVRFYKKPTDYITLANYIDTKE
jgi:hypothetical protein